MRFSAEAAAVFLSATLTVFAQPPDDAAVRAAVERYYRAIEAEDVSAYLALWSAGAQRPLAESVTFLFDAIDDRFPQIAVLRSVPLGPVGPVGPVSPGNNDGRLRVYVQLRRERTRRGRGGEPDHVTGDEITTLTFARENGELKVVSEGPPAETLAAELAAAATPEQRTALLDAEPDLLGAPLVSALSRVAATESGMQRYPRAEQLFRLAVELARRTGSRKEEGEALHNIGTALYFQRRFPEAMAAYEERRALEQHRGDDLAMAAALVGIATIHYTVAEYTQALAGYRTALAIQDRVEDRPAAAVTLISTGNVRYVQGDYRAALRDYARSRELHRAMRDTAGEARALEGLGRTYAAQGDYAAALAAFSGVLEEARARGDRARQGTSHQSVADIHVRLGNLDAARSEYEQGRDHFTALGQLGDAGRSWQGLGMTELLAGRFAEAERAYGRSIAACTEGLDPECTAHAVVGLAFAQYAQDKFEDAAVSYRRAVAAFTKLVGPEPAARAEIGLSQALFRAGALEEAAQAAARARSAAVALGNDDVLWRALLAESRVAHKRPDGGALAPAGAAAVVVERMHEEAMQKPATAIPSDAPAALAALAVRRAWAGDHEEAWRLAIRIRELDVRAALAVNERDIARGMTAQEREEERAAALELLSLLAQRAREQGLPRPDEGRLSSLSERIAAAAASRAAAMQKLFGRHPDLPRWRGLERISIAAAQSNIPEGTVVLDFIVDDDDVLLTVARAAPHAVTAYPIALRRRELSERISALLDERTLRDSGRWRAAASELGSRLLPAAVSEALAGARHVLILPHDVLWRVPFEALPAGDRYLGERTPVSYVGSYLALLHPGARHDDREADLTAIGASVLSDAEMKQLRQTAPGWKLRPPEAAARELAGVAGVYEGRATVLAGAGATEPAIRDRLASASRQTAVHIASPFRLNAAGPLFSPVLLSGGADAAAGEDDGVLELRELLNMNVAARTAVLSDGSAMSMRDAAARSGMLQWGWLAAGVPALACPRWTVDEEAARATLIEFHRDLRAGKSTAEALQAARAAVRARAEWSAPYYWAAWIAFGS
ncbi:MAG TPA: CHAT domain-containing protein [Vicinamibacterales bacterium]|nr:CHAT domain-containing protein [Vicinamibacterales bacterium]